MQNESEKKKERKPLTAEQRARKNAHDREVRARKKAQLAAIAGNSGNAAQQSAPKERTRSVQRTIQARAVLGKIVASPATSVSRALREIGANEHLIKNPQDLTQSREFQEVLDEKITNDLVVQTHLGLLKAARIDHMTFISESEGISDADITAMFAELNCTVRKIIHRDTGARDVYFWSPDNRARKDALDMVYKLRGAYTEDKARAIFSLAALARSRDAERLAQGSAHGASVDGDKDHDGIRLPRAA